MVFKHKKGISPLIATILLVAFSIGLGALVMSWGEEYVEEKAEFVQGVGEVRTGCDAVELSIINIGGVPQVCRTPDTIQLWIDNGPNIDVFNIHARIAGRDDVQVIEELLAEPLLRENAVKLTIPYDARIGTLLQVKLTPKIWTGKDVASCTDRALLLEHISPC